jgi:prepilin peptidase CpaA
MSLDWVRLAAPVVFAALLLIAAIYDIRQRRIPNWTVAMLILAYLGAAPLHLTPQGWAASLGAFAVAMIGSGALYLFGVLGAGDSKLFSASALFLGFGNLLLLTCTTAIAGGVLALGFLMFRPRSALSGLTARGRAEEGKSGIPYGVAIAIGGVGTAVLARYLWPHQHFTHYDPTAL